MGLLQKIKETISSKLGKYNPWSGCIGLYLFAMVNDWISSSINNHNVGIIESNPFTRDADFHFLLHKALVVDSLYFVFLSASLFALYLLVRPFSERIARLATAGVYFYVGIDRLFSAVLPNYLLALHPVYRPSIFDLLHL